MKMKGIDVSSYQGEIDFNQVKNAGIEFVIIKAGVSTRTDTEFENNYQKAKEAGLHIGFYWYCYGETYAEISDEADACISALENKQFDFPVYMDLEEKSQFDLGKEFCSDAVRTFCGKLKNAGYYPGLYSSTSYLNSVIDEDVKKKYTIWVADWRGYCGYNGEYGMWQYGAGYVPGINGKTEYNILDIGYDTDYPGSVVADGVDLDYSYKDFPLEIVFQGLNNYPKLEEEPVDDNCKDVIKNIRIQGVDPAEIRDNWFLIDKSGKFTLKALKKIKVNVYLVGGGEDGAEWFYVDSGENWGKYDIKTKSRGGCVCTKQIYINGNVQCQAIVAERNNPMGTSLKIGNDIYKCTDEGYIQRKATANGKANIDGAESFNGENGANGVKTPYGYVGSSGGGGGDYSFIDTPTLSQTVTVYAGRGGVGAGNGGEVRQNGTHASNYGCGGGSAGFGGFTELGDEIKTYAGHGMKGCIIFEISDSEACGDFPDSSVEGHGSCGCSCECPHHEFTCPDPPQSSSECEKEINYKLEYENGEPVITENTASSSGGNKDCNCTKSDSYNNNKYSDISHDCGCSNENHINGNSCGCGGSNSVKKGRCVNLDVSKWGENWLLFDKDGEYSLTIDEDISLTLYLVGGGSDGKDGICYNRTAYGGEGGKGGCYNVIPDIKITKGQMYINVKIGKRGDFGGTSVIINGTEYCCNSPDCFVNNGGLQGISGKHGYSQAGNGANGIETPFGYIGSSGGGGAAYYNLQTTSRGRGGLYAGNGGKIINGKATPGDKASGYGCGGGGGSASPTSWCEGGKGKQGCVILGW